MTELLEDPQAAGRWCAARRAEGRTLGFVPTMGALHEGHLELARRAKRENELAVVSVFVNPLQFDDPRDLARYPRDLEGDLARLASVGVDLAFTGTLAGFFPGELDEGGRLRPESWVDPGPAARGLEGAHRKGHFEGVATIVERLFALARPTRAYFGQKDFQQCLVVRALARRRGGPELVVCPTVREPSGLAMSSRNRLLDEAQRARAAAISRALFDAERAFAGGERDARRLGEGLRRALEAAGLEVDYAEVRDPERWSERAPEAPLARAVALVAARVGGVRLIDNHLLDGRPLEELA